MKNVSFFAIILFSIFSLHSQIHNNIDKPSLSKVSLAEKIYLQLDNTLYQTGENIWFKAVIAKSYDNSLSDISTVLHVELIDNGQNVVQSQLLKLDNGIASGSFAIEKGYNPGKYQVRAFTKWNRNFENNFVFNQPIEIINLKKEAPQHKVINNVVIETGTFKSLQAEINPGYTGKRSNGKMMVYVDIGRKVDSVLLEKNNEGFYKLNYGLPEDVAKAEITFKVVSESLLDLEVENFYSETIIIDEDHLDLQFFPEGGQLVNGLVSTVGFKALDYNGLGYYLKGIIKNNNGEVVTSFSSNKLGMGTFKLMPEQNKNYYAVVEKNGISYKYNLPVAKVTGTVITVASLKEKIKLLIVSNTRIGNKITVHTASRGVKYHDLTFEHKDSIYMSIPRNTLPDGIIKITVLNDKNQKIAERLFLNEVVDNRIDLEIRADNLTYRQREKTTLEIGVDNLNGFNNMEGVSLSVLVLNGERAKTSNKLKPNILSHLLLGSELKGFIEEPKYYFDQTNADRTLDIDALMLTQGWRQYKYQNADENPYYSFEPDKNLVVTGTIGEFFNPNKKPKKPLDLNLIVYGETVDAYTQEIDPSGRYRFDVNDIYKPNAELFMQVVDKKGKPVDFNINLDSYWSPEIQSIKAKQIQLPKAIITSFTESAQEANRRMDDYRTYSNTVALDEVELKPYKLTPKREEFISYHGEPDVVIDGKELNEKAPDWNYGVFSVLRAKYRDKIEIKLSRTIPSFLYAWDESYDATYTLVDNIPVYARDYGIIQNIPANEVESIDIIRNPKDRNRYCTQVFDGVNGLCPQTVVLVNIYTKSGNGLFGIEKTKGALNTSINGFTESVLFYAPNYEVLSSQDWLVPDNRSVIHWNPDLKPDKDGRYTLEYYNDDYVGEIKVVVEAISKDGKIGYVEKTYTIKEAER